jgi:hypothetical protein
LYLLFIFFACDLLYLYQAMCQAEKCGLWWIFKGWKTPSQHSDRLPANVSDMPSMLWQDIRKKRQVEWKRKTEECLN